MLIGSQAVDPRRGDIPAWAGWCFIGLGTISFLFGLGFGVRSVRIGFGTVRTVGAIVEVERRSGPRSDYYPLVAYVIDGASYQCKGIVGSNFTRWKRGQRVGVLYRPDRPSLGYLDTFFDRWLIPLAFGAAGLFFIGFGRLAMRPEGPPAKLKPKGLTDLE